jgi:N-acetylmuramic acid 6-phosphate etherase
MKRIPLEYLGEEEIIVLMDQADARAFSEVVKARCVIAAASRDAAVAIGAGGRLIYVGAGTSGRLGALDASECPPTFSANPKQVIAVMAGGKKAFYRAVEGAEDDASDGAASVASLDVGPRDMVMGIAASGRTPFVLAALDEARSRGAAVWLLSCSGKNNLPEAAVNYRTIALDTGDEVIRGSSRLAAGTATKLVLNRITTAAFIKLGKVYDSLMVDVKPTNKKLVKRAAGIIAEVTGCTADEALESLRESGFKTKTAVLMRAKGLTRREADALLREKGGFLRKALEEGKNA